MNTFNCPNCNKDFNKKQHLQNHLNKKISCIQIHQNTPIYTNEHQNTPKTLNNLKCSYCNKVFSNNFSLNRHLESRCKVKNDDDNNKKNIFELLLEQERKEKELLLEQERKEKQLLLEQERKEKQLLLEEKEQEKKEKEILNNKVDELQKQLLELTKTIKELSNKSSTIINNNNNNYGNVNNITIPLDKLSKFGKEDLTKITHKEFLKVRNYQGVAIFMETAKLIYNNHSVNKTVYVADYSRKKAMIWNGERWVLTCLDEILDVMKERIRTLYNINLDLIEDEKIIRDFNNRVQKYFDMLYDEYDEEKKDDKKFIDRVNKLQEKYGNDLILWLTNIKKDVVDNFNNIASEVTNGKLLLIDNDNIDDNNEILIDNLLPVKTVKKRGRPKKS